MRDSFIFYRSFYEAMKELPKENQAEAFAAICEFSLNGKEPKLTGISKTVFILMRPNLEANNRRYENGAKPKRKQTRSKPEAKGKQDESKPEGNKDKDANEDKDNYKDNDLNDDVHVMTLEQVQDYFLNDHIIQQMVCTENKFDLAELVQAMKEFWNTRSLMPEATEKPYNDTQRHFLNWCRQNKARIKGLPKNGQKNKLETLNDAVAEAKRQIDLEYGNQ